MVDRRLDSLATVFGWSALRLVIFDIWSLGFRIVEWFAPWHSVADDPAQMDGMAVELCREMAPGHPLYGLPVRTLARRQDCDDVLFAIKDGSGRVAVVHLTWTRTPPEQPPFPWTTLYSSLSAWAAEGMRLDAEEFAE